jgi:hypothetical protein
VLAFGAGHYHELRTGHNGAARRGYEASGLGQAATAQLRAA